MPGNLVAYLEVAMIGATSQRAFTGTSARVELVASPTQPTVWLLRSNQDVRIRQGDNTVEAGQTDFLLLANTYLQIVVTTTSNNNIAAITPTAGTNGTLDCTLVSDSTP